MKNLISKVKDDFRFMQQYFTRNRQYNTDCALPGSIMLYYWKLSSETQNLGDYLSEVVVRHFVPNIENNTTKKTCTMYGIGSILGFRCQNAVVWGSGILSPYKSRERNIRHSTLNIRAVRGPKTRDLLLQWGKQCPEVYGDPAILMPYIYHPKKIEKKYKTSLVLHYENNQFAIPKDSDIHLLDIKTSDYMHFIDEILQSSLVISSSLHGIILAETYGIPAILLLKEDAAMFKYEDWYASTGRTNVIIARSIEEALSMDPMPTPDLAKMQQNLINVFPADLWI